VYSDLKRENFNVVKFDHDHIRPDSSAFFPLSIQAIGNNLWVNSFNNAIYIIDQTLDPPRVTERLTSDVGLPDNTVYASIPDGMGKVWISHNSGVSSYDEHSHQFTHFSVSEGLQDEEFNRLAYFKSPSGEIMLGGINGLNIFDPTKIKLPELNLSVKLIDAISYPLNKPSVVGNEHSLIKLKGQLQLPFDNNSLQFSFFVPDFHEPIRHRIRYRLEPFDATWIDADRLTSGTYTNLNPGNYTFTVKVTDPAGREAVDKVDIIITPPYWKTWWFMTLFGIGCSLLVTSIIFSSVQSSRREKARLEELLKVRTHEIEQSREELENLNRKKDLIFSILSHDLRSPLTTLKGFLGLLIDHSDSLSKADLQRYATSIRNSVTTSLDLIDNTLFWSLSQTGNIQCTPTSVQLTSVFEKIKGLYQLTAERKHLTINFPNTNGLAVFADENMVYVLFRNLVSNAIKFTPEMNTIRVEAYDNGEDVSVSIKDSGIGMTSEEINKIFLFDNPMVKKGTSSEKGTGLGLILCKKFVEANRGKLLIESKPGVGSVFTVVLPKAR
jgi:signal transduction histidine kinase